MSFNSLGRALFTDWLHTGQMTVIVYPANMELLIRIYLVMIMIFDTIFSRSHVQHTVNLQCTVITNEFEFGKDFIDQVF